MIIKLTIIFFGDRLKKSAEHRKNVLQKKQRLEEKKAAVPFEEIVKDVSENKVTSHHRLLTFIDKFGSEAFVKSLTKKELLQLCKAYGLFDVTMRLTKSNLGIQLVPLMKESQSVRYSYFLDNLDSEVHIDDTNRRVTVTISRRCLR